MDPVDDAASVDEALEGATATWAAPRPGHADILSVVAEEDLLTLRNATSEPPAAGQTIKVRVPDFMGSLLALWHDDYLAKACLEWLDKPSELDPLVASFRSDEFPHLRQHQREAFELLRHTRGFLFGPPGTGKTVTLGCLLAAQLTQSPNSRALLLSSTNTAVDQALLATDDALQLLGRFRPGVNDLRMRCKRVGLHFAPSRYQDKQHLLYARAEPIAKLTALEAKRPDSTDDRAYGDWRDAVESIRREIREKSRKELLNANLHAMTTTRAAFDFEMLRDFSYDLVVFDEASQVNLAHSMMLAQLARRSLFIGDPRQLAPIVQSDLPSAQEWMGRSLFDLAPTANGPWTCHLVEQNRMAEEICRVVSGVFYEGCLRVADDARTNPDWISERRIASVPDIGDRRVFVRMIHQEATFANPGWYRLNSMEFVCQTALVLSRQIPHHDILVLTPYRAQRNRIKRHLRELGLNDVVVSTVHRAQGSERHTVLFDPVRGNSRWLKSAEGQRLINVAISRAKARLVVIMSRGDRENVFLDLVARIADTSDSPF